MHPNKRAPGLESVPLDVADAREKLCIGNASVSADIDWRMLIDAKMFATLKRVSQLQAYAKRKGCQTTQLAVPASDFVQWGHDFTQLRVLLVEGILVHLNEAALRPRSERRLVECNSLVIHSRSCFLLSDAGLAAIAELMAYPHDRLPDAGDRSADQKCRPIWDIRLRELAYQGKLVKRFRCPAYNQEAILCAFQEEGWPDRISDPLPPTESCDSKQRLHDAIRSLNRNQINSLLHFRGDGTAEGILWQMKQAASRLPTSQPQADT